MGSPLKIKEIFPSKFVDIISNKTEYLITTNKFYLQDQELDAGLKLQYWSAFDACRRFKIINKGCFGILTFMNIKDCVNIVHNQLEQNKEGIKISIITCFINIKFVDLY